MQNLEPLSETTESAIRTANCQRWRAPRAAQPPHMAQAESRTPVHPPVTAISPAVAAAPSQAVPSPPATAATPPTRLEWYRVVRRQVEEVQTTRFWLCHTKPAAAAAERSVERGPRPWRTVWVQACDATSTGSVMMEVWDTMLGTKDRPFTAFHVLGWNKQDTVLGLSARGETHLRVLPTRMVPRDTRAALRRIQDKGVGLADGTQYTPDAFEQVTYVRPACGGEPQEEPALIIKGGPLVAMTCNQVRLAPTRHATGLSAHTRQHLLLGRRCARSCCGE
eukprot:COSAG06_NODE_8206_length_2239_cov_1.975234_1_plen_279_part_00